MKELAKEFIGRGEVRGFIFRQLKKSKLGYIYEVNPETGSLHYEVFRKKINERYQTVTYPKSGSFSKIAWTYNSFEEALDKFKEL